MQGIKGRASKITQLKGGTFPIGGGGGSSNNKHVKKLKIFYFTFLSHVWAEGEGVKGYGDMSPKTFFRPP